MFEKLFLWWFFELIKATMNIVNHIPDAWHETHGKGSDHDKEGSDDIERETKPSVNVEEGTKCRSC
jgi:hypothetical protein